MGDDISKGTTYTEGQQVSAQNLNAHVDEATIKYTAISAKTLKDPASISDELLINDEGVLKKITLQQISSVVATPVGTIVDFAGAAAPSGWLMCYGQAISRVTYSGLFLILGVGYGAGDGVNTFNIPDCRGRVTAAADNMGGTFANRLLGGVTGGVNFGTLTGVGGEQAHVQTEAEMAQHAHGGGAHYHNVNAHQHYSSTTHTHGMLPTVGGYVGASSTAASTSGAAANYCINPVAHSASLCQGAAPGWTDAGYGVTTTDSQGIATDYRGSNWGHNNVQPTIVFNKIIKI